MAPRKQKDNANDQNYERIFNEAQYFLPAVAGMKFAEDGKPEGMKKSLDRIVGSLESDSGIGQMLQDYGENHPEEAVQSASDIFYNLEGQLKVKDLPRFYDDAIDEVAKDEEDREAVKELFSEEYFGDQTLAELHSEVMESQRPLQNKYASREEKEEAREYMKKNQRKMIALQISEQLGLLQSGVYEMDKESAVSNVRELFGRYRPNAEE